MSSDFERIARSNLRVDYPAPRSINAHSWDHVVYAILMEMRKSSDTARQAMLDVEWPPEMSASDQMAALFRAGIDAILASRPGA